jgi:hypothetical protein
VAHVGEVGLGRGQEGDDALLVNHDSVLHLEGEQRGGIDGALEEHGDVEVTEGGRALPRRAEHVGGDGLGLGAEDVAHAGARARRATPALGLVLTELVLVYHQSNA